MLAWTLAFLAWLQYTYLRLDCKEKAAYLQYMLPKDEIAALLVEKGYFCETEKITEVDAAHLLAWAGGDVFFVLCNVKPRDYTDCVLPAAKLKRWPIVLGFGDGAGRADSMGRTLVDGLHRCAVANARGIQELPAYVPCDRDGKLLDFDRFWAM